MQFLEFIVQSCLRGWRRIQCVGLHRLNSLFQAIMWLPGRNQQRHEQRQCHKNNDDQSDVFSFHGADAASTAAGSGDCSNFRFMFKSQTRPLRTEMKRIIASSTRIMPMTLKTTGTLKLKLRGGDLENQSCGNCTPAPPIMSRTKYGTTNPMTKPRINSMIAIFMACCLTCG